MDIHGMTDISKMHAEFMKTVDPGGKQRISHCSRPKRAVCRREPRSYLLIFKRIKEYIYESILMRDVKSILMQPLVIAAVVNVVFRNEFNLILTTHLPDFTCFGQKLIQ